MIEVRKQINAVNRTVGKRTVAAGRGLPGDL